MPVRPLLVATVKFFGRLKTSKAIHAKLHPTLDYLFDLTGYLAAFASGEVVIVGFIRFGRGTRD